MTHDDDTNELETPRNYRRRSEDNGTLGAITHAYHRFKPIWILLAAFIVALGFGFRTPAETFKSLQSQIDDAVRIARADSANLDKLIKLACLDTDHDQRVKELVGLPCTR
jgi:hypothetical protein